MKRLKLISMVALVSLAIFLAGCFGGTDFKGTYNIQEVILVQNTHNIMGFDTHRNGKFEFIISSKTATASYIIFTDTNATKTYQAQTMSTGSVTYRTNGNQIILEGGQTGIGSMDIRVHEGGWLILNYRIENQLVYTAKYRK
jgi:hypothetical protein